MPIKQQSSYNKENIPSKDNDINIDKLKIYTRPNIGYADGYDNYKKKSAAHNESGEQFIKNVENNSSKVKSKSPKLMLENHIDTFKRIDGYQGQNFNSKYEDPLFLIFDLELMTMESPLFGNDLNDFLNEYRIYDYDISDIYNLGLLDEFKNRLLEIFPSSTQDGAGEGGQKRHYIESIGNLKVFDNPIIKYPEDKITISLTEDVAMTTKYLSELYNHLTYSYRSHRYLIPENLLRFNIRITMRDIRNMRKNINQPDRLGVNEDISQFIYILNDCQFDFLKTKVHPEEIKRGGFGSPKTEVTGPGVIDVFFKSYSKIMVPLLKEKSKIIDLRERENKRKDDYKFIAGNKDEKEIIESEYINEYNDSQVQKKLRYSRPQFNLTNPLDGLQIPEVNTDIRGFGEKLKSEVFEVRDVIIKKMYSESNRLIDRGQRWLGENAGFTIGKVNVYYDSLEEKVTRFSWMFESVLNKATDDVLGRSRDLTLREGKLHGDSTYNKKYPDGDLHEDGEYHDKQPDGDLHEDGEYNEKHPDGDLHDDSTYNEKHPDGDLHEDGEYHDKQPGGDLHDDSTYNEKHPDGDLHEDGEYHDKQPGGDLHDDSTYNEKYPDGDLHENSTYNEKYPDGDLHDDSTYNEKHPDGDLHEDGEYHDKQPDGDLYEDSTYNEKHPDGDLHEDGEYHDKQPKGNLYDESDKIEDKDDLGNVYKNKRNS